MNFKFIMTADTITNNEDKAKRFVEAVFWILRSGAKWRMLPKEYGDWNVVYQRFSDWAERGVIRSGDEAKEGGAFLERRKVALK